jgi:hypothetical protein
MVAPFASLLLTGVIGFSHPSGVVSGPVRSSAVTMGPIRAIKRVLGVQKQNFLEATVRGACRAPPASSVLRERRLRGFAMVRRR